MKKDDLKNKLLVEDPPTHHREQVMKRVQSDLDQLRTQGKGSWFDFLARRQIIFGALGSLALGWFGWKLVKDSGPSADDAAMISFSEMDPHYENLELMASLEINADDLWEKMDDDLEMLEDDAQIEELGS